MRDVRCAFMAGQPFWIVALAWPFRCCATPKAQPHQSRLRSLLRVPSACFALHCCCMCTWWCAPV